MKTRLLTIQAKIALWAGIGLFATIFVLVAYTSITARSTSIVAAKEALQNRAMADGNRIRAQVEEVLSSSRAIANVLTSIKSSGSPITRERVDAALRSVLERNPSFIGVYTAWEPNAYDGLDSRYVSSPASDRSGRFIPYWNRGQDGTLAAEPLMDYENTAIGSTGGRKGDYYLIPRETKRECVIEPYIYPVQGRDVLMTSLVVPIVIDDKFYGISGADLELEFLQKMADGVKSGELYIFSHGGLIAAATGKPDIVGKPLSDVFGKWSGLITSRIKEAREDVQLGATTVDVFMPISFGRTRTPWMVMLRVPKSEVTHAATMMMWQQVLLGLVLTFAALAWLWMAAGAIARPIGEVIRVARMVATGDLAAARQATAVMIEKSRQGRGQAGGAESDVEFQDETGQLVDAVTRMTSGLATLASQAQKSCVRLVSTATQIATTSRQQEATMADFGTSTTEVAAAVREISATSQELVRTMEGVKEASGRTESLADSGRTGLANMGDVMRRMVEATEVISSKLNVINERAMKIGGVVTTITKVADQTNLLSLNAAIEAEKAGEYGLGFAVVSREIRRLADQTAVATLDIERMVQEMQASVATGVMEMDKFTSEVRRAVASVDDMSQQMGQVIEQTKELAPRFDSVNEGMRVQSQGAQQINDAMLNLTESARRLADSLRQFNESTVEVRDAARELQAEVAQFKV